MSYFTQFPKINYSLENDGNIMKIVDLFRFAIIDEKSIGSDLAYTYYDILDGERPDVVSHKLYGSPDYYWAFFLLNSFLYNGHCVWPMSQLELNNQLESKYSKYGMILTLPYVWYVPNNILRGAPYLQLRNANAIPFDEKYLPYLKIQKGDQIASIKEYIPSMYQIVFENDGLSNTFYNDGDFYIFFDGNNELKSEWEAKMFDMMKLNLPDRLSYTKISDYYLFTNLCTPNFQNAPAYYYDSITGEKISAHDALKFSNYDGIIPETNTNYKTIKEAAKEENNKRKKIKVVKKEYIRNFVSTWKKVING